MLKKGVIASPIEFEYKMVGFRVRTGLSQEMLRYYLLYWDEIVVPDDALLGVGGFDLKQLESLDCVYRPLIKHKGHFSGHEIADAVLQGQYELARLLHKDPNVDWVLHQSNSDRLAGLQKDTIEQNALKLRLSNLLPVPTADVPFHDLVNFRQRRYDEFSQLHALLDELYLQVLSSPDQPLSEKKVTLELRQLVDDLDKLTKERFGLLNKISIEPSYDLKVKDLINYPLITNALSSFNTFLENGGVTDYNSLAATSLGLAIGVASNINIKISLTKKPKGCNDKPRLSFIADAAKEGLIAL